ncbi:nucleoside hydrolase [Falsiroseomonas tokyonensis]|uniref:Nucleoside hydrolase n=1 Tax=Falsiroseomonas tokyonensis TaxID=430521 RepID=A0ABV7C071_9PROT|nr:nucleoside hydrolase [Falsiroseomonas tokyonensis]
MAAGGGGPLHAPTVIAYLLRPELFGVRPAHVAVELSGQHSFGQTVGDFSGTTGKPPNATVLNRLDAPGFSDLLWERLARS